MNETPSAAPAYGASLCAHTDFECDCDCGCPSYGGDPNHECDWPDCGCGCKPGCKGCALVQEAQGV